MSSLQWTLENPKVDTICPSMPDFDLIEKTLPVSGATLTKRQAGVLHSCQSALQHH